MTRRVDERGGAVHDRLHRVLQILKKHSLGFIVQQIRKSGHLYSFAKRLNREKISYFVPWSKIVELFPLFNNSMQ